MATPQALTGAAKNTKSNDLVFFIQFEGLVCNLTAGEYVIAVRRGAKKACFLLIDDIQNKF